MPTKAVWGFALVLALALAGLLVHTEGRYVGFIESLGEIEVTVSGLTARWEGETPEARKLELTFTIDFRNTSDLVMWVEAINGVVRLGEAFLGTYTIQEGNYRVAPGEARALPLVATLWQARQKELLAAREAGQPLVFTARSRVRFDLGNARLKSFYSVFRAFEPETLEGL